MQYVASWYYNNHLLSTPKTRKEVSSRSIQVNANQDFGYQLISYYGWTAEDHFKNRSNPMVTESQKDPF